ARFEEFHQVRYTHEAIRAAVELSVRHLTDRFLPDKAIDVIDEVGARSRIKRAKESKGRVHWTPDGQLEISGKPELERTVIDEQDIEEMVAKIARIPARSVSHSQRDRL